MVPPGLAARAHEEVPVLDLPVAIVTSRALVERLRLGPEHRKTCPSKPSSHHGIKGGIAGGIAMIFPALIYGLIGSTASGTRSICWRRRLSSVGASQQSDIAAFHWQGLLMAIVIHVVTSVLVGLLYGAMLPMLPRYPILLGGILAPVLWTGILLFFLGIINPVLDPRIAWTGSWSRRSPSASSPASSSTRQRTIPTVQSMPFVVRLGIEAAGMMDRARRGRGDHRPRKH